MKSRAVALVSCLLTAGAVVFAAGQQTSAPPLPDGPLHIVSLLHFIHATDTVEKTLGFYHDVFGVEGGTPRANTNPGVGLLNGHPGIGLRAVRPKLGDEAFMEITEFSKVEKHGAQGLATDPGAVELILPVRDLDAVVAAAKKRGAPIVTRSGAPVTVMTKAGAVRAIVMRDPDGYLVRAVQAPAVLPGMIQPGVSMALAVRSLDDTVKFYRDVTGTELTGGAAFVHDEAMADVFGAPAKSQYREASFTFPGTKATRMEFYEWKGMTRTPFRLHVPDPGASGWVAAITNMDAMMKAAEAHHAPKVTPEPIWFSPTIYDIFIQDPDGMNLELYQTVPARKPAN
jgi:catechol 2,3-dioxygenase-like lactoylglutathione lyase family enzyme